MVATGRERTPGPWAAGDATLLFALVAVGGSLVVAGWYGASITAAPFDQIVWLNVGVLGVIVSGFGAVTWLLAGRRSIGRRAWSVAPSASRRSNVLPDPHDVPATLVTVAGGTRHHVASCPLVAGKVTSPWTAGDGRPPCPMCAA